MSRKNVFCQALLIQGVPRNMTIGNNLKSEIMFDRNVMIDV